MVQVWLPIREGGHGLTSSSNTRDVSFIDSQVLDLERAVRTGVGPEVYTFLECLPNAPPLLQVP